MNIYAYDSYHTYLAECLKKNESIRGYQSQLAAGAGMHPSYLSRILHGSIHLTPDQAAGLCNFWNLDREETGYFMNLVHHARAATPALRKMLETELQSVRKKKQELGNQLPAEKIDTLKENIYYSAWYYSAVHVLLTIPDFQTETAVAEKLNLPLQEARRILTTLEGLGLVTKNRMRWAPTKNNVHLSNDSWMAAIHHVNWRTKITDRIQFRNPEELHYTGLHTLSRADFKKIKAQLLEALVNVDKIVRPSKEEELCSLIIDWSIF